MIAKCAIDEANFSTKSQSIVVPAIDYSGNAFYGPISQIQLYKVQLNSDSAGHGDYLLHEMQQIGGLPAGHHAGCLDYPGKCKPNKAWLLSASVNAYDFRFAPQSQVYALDASFASQSL